MELQLTRLKRNYFCARNLLRSYVEEQELNLTNGKEQDYCFDSEREFNSVVNSRIVNILIPMFRIVSSNLE